MLPRSIAGSNGTIGKSIDRVGSPWSL